MSKNSQVNIQRRLIYIPIIHTQLDMGHLSETVKRLTIQKIGEEGWKHNMNLIDQVWTNIEQIINTLNLFWERVLVYQDGLPVCNKEVEIVEELAKKGSRNHQLLLRLKKNGAIIMGTESPELLLEEYQLVKQALVAASLQEATKIELHQKELSHSLLNKRDRFIADRINQTLESGQTGIIFLGMLHSLEEWLDKDIEIVYAEKLV